MARPVLLGLGLLGVVAAAAGGQQQQEREASQGKYKFSGTVAGTADVSGWFEVDINGRIWLTDTNCTLKRQARSATMCTIPSVKIRRVRSAYQLDVLVDVQVVAPADGGRIGAAPGPRKLSGTLTARRV